jgi:hypothetical protein
MEINGKSDQQALTAANDRNATRAAFSVRKLLHRKERDFNIAIDRIIRIMNIDRSVEFPSSKAWFTRYVWPLSSHCDGNRVATTKIQITGIHMLNDVFEFLPGSK